MKEVFDALHDQDVTTLVFLFARGSPISLGEDVNLRPQLSLNLEAMETRG